MLNTFGKANAGDVYTYPTADSVYVSKFTASASFSAKRAFICFGTTYTYNSRIAIYSDNSGVPGTLLAVSDEAITSVTSLYWAEAKFSSPVSITSGTTYWIGVHNKQSSIVKTASFTNGSYYLTGVPYNDGPPSTWSGGITLNYQISVYLDDYVDPPSSLLKVGSELVFLDSIYTNATIPANYTIVNQNVAEFDITCSKGYMYFNERTNADSSIIKSKMLVYADNSNYPSSLLATSDELIGLPRRGWATYNFSSPVSISAGTAYWIGLFIDTSVGTFYFSTNYYPNIKYAYEKTTTYTNGPVNPLTGGARYSENLPFFLAADSGTGIGVEKENILSVISPPTENISVAKANISSVISPPDLSIAKTNVYSVLSPPELSISKTNIYTVLANADGISISKLSILSVISEINLRKSRISIIT